MNYYGAWRETAALKATTQGARLCNIKIKIKRGAMGDSQKALHSREGAKADLTGGASFSTQKTWPDSMSLFTTTFCHCPVTCECLLVGRAGRNDHPATNKLLIFIFQSTAIVLADNFITW